MPRGLVTLFVALEALFVAGIGIGIVLVPLLIGWASVNHFQATPLDVWQLAVQAWALGHGVPLHVDLTGVDSIVPSSLAVFDITLALLGCALVTALLAVRTGRRIAETDGSLIVGGMLIAFVATIVGALLWTGQSVAVNIEVTQGTVKILIPFILGLLFGWKPWRLLSDQNPMRNVLPEDWHDVLVSAGRIAGGSFLGLIVVASLVLTVAIVSGFAAEIALYEAIHGGFLGGLVVTAGQLIALPTVLVWTMSWLIGSGFSLGLGTLVTPFSATIGAFPAIPLLGAIPAESVVVGWPILIIPATVVAVIAAHFSWGIVEKVGYLDPTGARDYIRLGVLVVLSAVLSAALFFIVGAFASGSAGPGRFVFVGVDPLDAAFAWGGLVLLGTLLGGSARLIRPLPREVAHYVDMRTR